MRPQWLDAQYSDHWSLADVLLREEPDEEQDEEDEGNITDDKDDEDDEDNGGYSVGCNRLCQW